MGAYVIAGPNEITKLCDISHEGHHILQSRIHGNMFLGNYFMQIFQAPLLTHDFFDVFLDPNWYEAIAYGYKWYPSN